MRPIVVFAFALAAGAAQAQPAYVPPPEPRLELGIGGLAMALPDYRGSDHYGGRLLPIPYAAYRSERVQLTREGLRARLFAVERLTASLSAAASLPGSDDNPDRAGMPRIDPTFEAGPSLDYLLHDGDGGRTRVKLRVPARATIAADGLELRDIGWVFVPHLRLDSLPRGGRWEWSHVATAGVLWATEDYHEYFYGVAPEYETATRPAYDAHGGYSGARMSLSSAVHHGRWRVGAFATWDFMEGAAFEDSPLLRTAHGGFGGVYFSYRLYASGVGEGLEDAP